VDRVSGETDSASDELLAIGQKWAEAERGGDVAALDELLGDDFVGVGPLGFMLVKEQWLGRYKSGDLENINFGWEPVRIRSYGTVAVVIGIQSQETTYKGHPIDSGRFRGTQVLLKDQGHWRLISMQLSNLADGAA
jgi:ketosteroid isomerase-like protein